MEVAPCVGRRKLDAEMGHCVWVIFIGIEENVQPRPGKWGNLEGATE